MTRDEVREALEALAEENHKIMRRAAIEADRRYAEAAKKREWLERQRIATGSQNLRCH